MIRDAFRTAIMAKDKEAFLKLFLKDDIRQVWFDYVFMDGDDKQNRGKESWQVVGTETGWKIAALVWSQERNPVPPPQTRSR